VAEVRVNNKARWLVRWTMLPNISSIMTHFHAWKGWVASCLASSPKQFCQKILLSSTNVCRMFDLNHTSSRSFLWKQPSVASTVFIRTWSKF
jgi:phage-related protein